MLIISYEMLQRNYEHVKKVQFDLVVCDEGHRLKNTDTTTYKVGTVQRIDLINSVLICISCYVPYILQMLSKLMIKRRIILTGTPVQNDLRAFYAIASFCNPSVFGMEHIKRSLNVLLVGIP